MRMLIIPDDEFEIVKKYIPLMAKMGKSVALMSHSVFEELEQQFTQAQMEAVADDFLHDDSNTFNIELVDSATVGAFSETLIDEYFDGQEVDE